jgi:hypothetical protein
MLPSSHLCNSRERGKDVLGSKLSEYLNVSGDEKVSLRGRAVGDMAVKSVHVF